MIPEGWNWITAADICLVHDDQITRYGGLAGIRDTGAVESAADRPRNVETYRAGADAADLSAAYAFGIARGHVFVDGNKRTAWVVSNLFLLANGFRMRFDEREAEEAVVRLAEGRMSEGRFADWIRERIERQT